MFEYVELEEARRSGSAYLLMTGEPASDGTARYYGRVALVNSAGVSVDVVRGKRRTFEELRSRAEGCARKRGIALIVMQLPELRVASVSFKGS